ncbi:hypothetical protein [Arthrobacter sp. HLT1-20]
MSSKQGGPTSAENAKGITTVGWQHPVLPAAEASGHFVGVGMLAGMVLLIIARCRVLNNKVDEDTVVVYCRRTPYSVL